MSKFSITQLEVVRRDPTSFARNLKSAVEKKSFFGQSKFTRWQNSVGEFHKKNDLGEAIKYLENAFSNRADTAKNRREVAQLTSSLDSYVKQYEKKEYSLLERKKNIHITLNSKVYISGQIPLVFMNPKGGFSVYFFTQSIIGWENELRFPVIQKYFGEQIYGVDPNRIEVGVFSTDNNKFNQVIFKSDEIDKADKELKKIGKIFFDIL